LNEKTLLNSLKNKKTKKESFKELVAIYKERLYWHIRKMVKSHEDTDDILQNTFIKVYNNIESFNEKSKLYSWMYRIATNETITFLNKKAKRNHVSFEELSINLVSSLQEDIYYNGNSIQLELQKAIATLPQKQQLVFNMKYFDEMKYTEISEILKTSVGALKASYHHATKKIKNYLHTQVNL